LLQQRHRALRPALIVTTTYPWQVYSHSQVIE
jgi:hypothetical protein